MTAEAFVAVDLGAQSGRVMLGVFDDGFALHEAHRFANVPVTIDGTLCWDVRGLFTQTLEGIAAALRLADHLRVTVRGIGVDSWGVDYGLVRADGSLVAPVRHYRATTSADLASAAERVDAATAYARTGILESPINTCVQLHRDALAGLLDGDVVALLIPDLWTAWLTGAIGSERTIASTTGLLDRARGSWSTELAGALGIPPQVLPPLVDAGAFAATTLPHVTERVGAATSIPVIRVPGHDTACAFAAVTAPGDRQGVISCGTWALVGCATPDAVLSEQARHWGFTNEEGVDRAITLIRNLSGTWLLEECLKAWAAESGEVPGLRSRLIAEAAALTPIESAIDVGSPALLQPGDMPARIAEAYRKAGGGEAALTPSLTVRVIIDSLAACFGETIERMQQLTGVRVDAVTMIGGGANIEPLVERTAELSRLPVRVGHSEATSIGNICVQAVASGMMPSLGDAREHTSNPSRGSR